MSESSRLEVYSATQESKLISPYGRLGSALRRGLKILQTVARICDIHCSSLSRRRPASLGINHSTSILCDCDLYSSKN
jgi:hypothetical protein